MAKYINPDVLDASLDMIADADKASACSAQPATYYEACNPAAWTSAMSAILEDAVRPTARNGYVYECTTAGTAGTTEPVWPTTAAETVTDGTIVWTCRANHCLAAVSLASGDFTIADGTTGRKITIAEKAGLTIHTTGDVSHTALISDVNKSLILVTTCITQTLTQGNVVNMASFSDEVSLT